MSTLTKFSFIFRRNNLVLHLLAFAFAFLIASTVHAGEADAEFQKANALYQKQNYDSAAKIYEQLIAQEYHSPEIYYNLANSYYKTNNTARAILNYERALKLKPQDEDIIFNIKVAQLKAVDKIEPVPVIFYRRWLSNIASLFSTDGWSRFVIICIWLMFVFATVYIVSPRTSMRRIGFVIAAFFLLLSLSGWALSGISYAEQVSQKSAVVMSVSAYVKSSPGDNNTDLFLLHEGTRVDIIDEYENWVKIRLSNGSIGWLKSSDMEII